MFPPGGNSTYVSSQGAQSHPADLLHLANCSKKSSQSGVALGAVSVATDVLALCLPIRVIMRMQLALAKKVGLVIVFLSGVL